MLKLCRLGTRGVWPALQGGVLGVQGVQGLLVLMTALCLALAPAGSVRAQESAGMAAPGASAADTADDLYATAQHWLDASLRQPELSPLPLRLEVELGRLDPRLQLAPCQQVEPYLPPGVRLWGRARLGLRCVQGPKRWNVFLPVAVRAYGPAWVVKGRIASGATLSAADAMLTEVDWAQGASPIVARAEDWVGQAAARPLAMGQALRQDMLKPAQAFPSGAQVRVVAAGPGFHIVGSAQALTAGWIGQIARVRMGNGQVVSGTVAADRSVQVVL